MYDIAEIRVKGGDGGAGVVSFRREKFVPFGGPDGGDGGRGGDVTLRADPSVSSLRSFRRNRLYHASNGERGRGKKQHGAAGADLILLVPQGTTVWEGTAEGKTLLADLKAAGEEAIVAHGGKGGLGNTHFATATNQVPRLAQKGQAVEIKSLTLEMRLIADVGVIGYPNVGKSSLLAAASAARPRVADYSFTTTQPVLGLVRVGDESFVLAEIPGLIPGAHLGKGLGHDFLRHALRTRVFIHLLDGASASPVEDMIQVTSELALFDPALARRPQIVAVNKIDLPQVKARLDEIRDALVSIGSEPFPISAATGVGVPELMAAAARMLKEVALSEAPRQVGEVKVFRPRPRGAAITVRREGDVFIVESDELERLVAGSDTSRPETSYRLKSELLKRGLNHALSRAGAKRGARVRLGSLEFTL